MKGINFSCFRTLTTATTWRMSFDFSIINTPWLSCPRFEPLSSFVLWVKNVLPSVNTLPLSSCGDPKIRYGTLTQQLLLWTSVSPATCASRLFERNIHWCFELLLDCCILNSEILQVKQNKKKLAARTQTFCVPETVREGLYDEGKSDKCQHTNRRNWWRWAHNQYLNLLTAMMGRRGRGGCRADCGLCLSRYKSAVTMAVLLSSPSIPHP